MSKITELLRQGRKEELWQMCCGFIDLSLEQFMHIQQRLLLEQIELLKNCELGRKVMRGAMPKTVEEFREQVPLTTYTDYCPELLDRREDVLPAKPAQWAHTSGRSGEYRFKWAPISHRAWEELGPLMYAGYILATCRKKGDVSIRPNPKLLYVTAPAPYTTGVIAYKCEEEFGFRYFPSPRESEQMSFMERLDKGFWLALSEGIDGFYGLSAILVGIGERFKKGTGSVKLSSLLSQPKVLLRLLKGTVRSKLARRPMLPKDLWSIKVIVCGGTGSVIFRDKIRNMWGVRPLDIYAGTEGLIIAMQTWDYEGMTFVPNLNFFEFIPETEHSKGQLDHSYQPKTVLLDEVKAGENYEIVITNFHGGAMMRYRPGDMIRISSLRNEELGIRIPQMMFERRADDLIDLGFIRLTERVIWQAIENTDIPYADWTARKEIIDERPALHLYLELKDGYLASEKGVATAVYEQIKRLDDGFIHYDLRSMERLLDFKPIEVTLLPEGAFANYMAQRQAEGADLAQLKVPHINPSDRMLSLLGAKVEAVPKVEVTAEAETGAVASQ
ncbi:MAG: GH3 auxin-responsive promoter family protein [Dehalococcoidia bacterium]|nr:GH3 auxin-responsive promoter family protein [Dehalococcoidia bacterium]